MVGDESIYGYNPLGCFRNPKANYCLDIRLDGI